MHMIVTVIIVIAHYLSYQVFKPNGYSASHHSAFCFKTCVKQELSPWDMSMLLEQDFKDCDDA